MENNISIFIGYPSEWGLITPLPTYVGFHDRIVFMIFVKNKLKMIIVVASYDAEFIFAT